MSTAVTKKPQSAVKVTNLSPSGAGDINLESFELGVTLGTGSFGRVRFCTHTGTGSIWAMKMLKKSEVLRLQQVEHILSEKSILSALDHPNIVKMVAAFQDPKYLYMVLEYVCGGEFFSHLRKRTRFESSISRFYAAQVTLVFEYLHNLDIIYRDLKPENLLLDETGYLKITDFGFAKRVTHKTYTLCGTPEYIAPEVLLNKGHGKGVDWWTLGILVYEMLVGRCPFYDDDPVGIYQQILKGEFRCPRWLDRNAKSLIKHLLVADITRRYGCLKDGALDIKNHIWFHGMSFPDIEARKVTAPFMPQVASITDTSNFDNYPDSKNAAVIPIYEGKDPFSDF